MVAVSDIPAGVVAQHTVELDRALDGVNNELHELRELALAAVDWYMAPDIHEASRQLGEDIARYLKRRGIEVGRPVPALGPELIRAHGGWCKNSYGCVYPEQCPVRLYGLDLPSEAALTSFDLVTGKFTYVVR